jgi:hypothetical protein
MASASVGLSLKLRNRLTGLEFSFVDGFNREFEYAVI